MIESCWIRSLEIDCGSSALGFCPVALDERGGKEWRLAHENVLVDVELRHVVVGADIHEDERLLSAIYIILA